MTLSRRGVLRGIVGGVSAAATALILPPALGEHVAEARRYWALDRTMLPTVDYGYLDNVLRVEAVYDDGMVVTIPLESGDCLLRVPYYYGFARLHHVRRAWWDDVAHETLTPTIYPVHTSCTHRP